MTILGIVVTARILIFFSLQAQVEQLNAILSERNQSTATEINNHIEDLLDQMDYLASLNRFTWFNPEIQSNLLNALLEDHPDFESIMLMDASGTVLEFASSQNHQFIDFIPDVNEVTDLLFRQEKFISNIALSPVTNQPYMRLAVPVADQSGEAVAFLVANLNLGFLCPIVCHNDIGENGRVYIIDDQYYLLPDPANPDQITAYALIENPYISTLPNDLGQVTTGLPAASLFPVYVGLNGNEVLRIKTPIPELGWQVIAELPSGVRYAPINRTLWIMGVLLATALLASVSLGIYLSKRVTKPLQRLTEAMAQITEGNLDVTLDFHRRDEVGRLATSFLRMKEQLRELIHNLQQELLERRRVEDQLRQLSENMAVAQRITHFGSWEIALTPDLEFIDPQFWTDECYHIFGVDPGSVQMTKELFYDALHPDDRERTYQTLMSAIREGKEATYAYRLIWKDGSIRYVTDNIQIILDEKTGKPVKVIGTVHDITNQTELEAENERLTEQFYQSQKVESIGRLAGGIAHDFNNLLVPILGYVDLGIKMSNPNDKVATYFKHIREAAERAASLNQQILAFGRKQVLRMQVVDLNEIIKEFNEILERLVVENVELTTLLGPNLAPVKIDKGQIEQVIMNLVINACDAMPEGGKLTIETASVYLDEKYVKRHGDAQEPGPYVMLAVSDTGLGMEKKILENIFEPFFTTKEKGRGTGLGLATVFGIVKQHGGNMWVYSEPGHGSTFKIYLPQVKDEVSRSDLFDTDPDSFWGSETILVVEDEKMVCNLVCETLSAHGYKVLQAFSPAEGIQKASEHKEEIDLLLTDVIMPGMNGRELYHEILTQHPEIKHLYMSGYPDDVISQHGILFEGANFIQKPFSILSLTHKVRWVLDQGIRQA